MLRSSVDLAVRGLDHPAVSTRPRRERSGVERRGMLTA
jgi:hypothetical protein